jgi:hypothetical protein
MDSNGFYSVNQNALQQPALTDFFVPDEESNLQQPPANLFALDGTGGNAGNPDSLYPYLGTMNGPFADLTNYQSFDQTRTTGNNFGPINNEDIIFGSPFSFVQRTLLQGSLRSMYSPRTQRLFRTRAWRSMHHSNTANWGRFFFYLMTLICPSYFVQTYLRKATGYL